MAFESTRERGMCEITGLRASLRILSSAELATANCKAQTNENNDGVLAFIRGTIPIRYYDSADPVERIVNHCPVQIFEPQTRPILAETRFR